MSVEIQMERPGTRAGKFVLACTQPQKRHIYRDRYRCRQFDDSSIAMTEVLSVTRILKRLEALTTTRKIDLNTATRNKRIETQTRKGIQRY